MNERVTRRKFLTTVTGSAAVAALAGCSGGGGDGGDGNGSTSAAPSEDDEPKQLLPKARNGWTRVDDGELVSGVASAQAGHVAEYRSGGETYDVEILRYESQKKAKRVVPTYYGDSFVAVVYRKNFMFAVEGPDQAKAEKLLGHSPGLSTEFVQDNNERSSA